MSMTLVLGLMTRACIVPWAMSFAPLLTLDVAPVLALSRLTRKGGTFVRIHIHIIDKSRNVEDLDIVGTQTARNDAAVMLACPRQQADDQRDAGTVDIIHI